MIYQIIIRYKKISKENMIMKNNSGNREQEIRIIRWFEEEKIYFQRKKTKKNNKNKLTNHKATLV